MHPQTTYGTVSIDLTRVLKILRGNFNGSDSCSVKVDGWSFRKKGTTICNKMIHNASNWFLVRGMKDTMKDKTRKKEIQTVQVNKIIRITKAGLRTNECLVI